MPPGFFGHHFLLTILIATLFPQISVNYFAALNQPLRSPPGATPMLSGYQVHRNTSPWQR